MSNWRARAARAGRWPLRPPAHGTGQQTDPAPEHSMDPWTEHGPQEPVPLERSVVDAAIYRDGQRVETPSSLAEIYDRLPGEPGTMAWITYSKSAPDSRTIELVQAPGVPLGVLPPNRLKQQVRPVLHRLSAAAEDLEVAVELLLLAARGSASWRAR
ncbi:hypothetical protein [Streptomyces sp. NBC_00467]|uniref:hypothetical protein n=1 Tax=Streptomyces sp. NBC_00467 TaxID=2975752 RepID=UPI002E178AA9